MSVEEICEIINKEYSKNSKRALYLSIGKYKDQPLKNKLLRLMKPNEHILLCHATFTKHNEQHSFYALESVIENCTNSLKICSKKLSCDCKFMCK